jgi:predicted acylesterase/phospholipase RssA
MGSRGSYARRKLTVAAVNVNNGNYEVFDESTPPKSYPTIVLASASVPFAFPPT